MRGTEPTGARLSGRASAFRPLVNRRPGGYGLERFKDVDQERWMEAIRGCLDAGAGLLISRTSDGGAISLTLYEGDERSRTYCADAGELAEALAAIRDRTKLP